ncbi:type I restriction-modification enzyme R subunit C-terminal domain-containing protein [Cohnella ginsengisoli]
MPDYIPSPAVNEFIFNQDTVDYVLETLMNRGIKVAGGDRLGKTIVFAQNKKHAQFIVDRFNKLYPQYNGKFAKRIISEDSYAQSLIDDFKVETKEPHIAVSVDMLDTGIDVPQIVNLVFFKRIRSKTKFWQMIGRGTRLCRDLFGDGQDKTGFVIFDYLGNFEFFRQHKEGLPGSESQSLSEAIFAKRVRLIHYLQEAAFAEDAYQAIRQSMVDTVLQQIRALNPELVSVKLQLQHVEKFKHAGAFVCLSDEDKRHLIAGLAPVVYMDDADEYAKRFDSFMYGLMLAQIEGTAQFNRGKKQLVETVGQLAKRATIPQIKSKLALIQTIATDEFWQSADVLTFEKVRAELRDLIKFMAEEGGGSRFVYTNLADEVLAVEEGKAMYQAYEFENYKLKVNRFIERNRDHLAIHKLRHNLPLSAGDYESLERIFTGELGTAEDYEREYKNTPFGLLVRKIAKLETEAANEAFSAFISDQSLSQQQIVFVKKVIDYVAQNGYIDQVSELVKPPFDKPMSFIKLFDGAKQRQLVEVVNRIKDNAVKVLG